nr:MAG: DNA pilot protein [Microvirus sp.]
MSILVASGVKAAVPLIASGVTAAGAIGSKLLGNAQSRKMADYEFSNNLKMWNLQNAYNSPAQQMQRLKDAGLNPNLVYGNGAVGNTAGNLPQYNAPTLDYSATDVIQSAGGVLSQFVNLQKVAMEKEVLAAQAESIRQRTVLDTLREVGLKESATKSKIVTDMLNDPMWHDERKQEYQASVQADWLSKVEKYFRDAELTRLSRRDVTARDVDIDIKKADLIFKELENDLRKSGITSSDHPIFRILIRLADSFGINPIDLLKSK